MIDVCPQFSVGEAKHGCRSDPVQHVQGRTVGRRLLRVREALSHAFLCDLVRACVRAKKDGACVSVSVCV